MAKEIKVFNDAESLLEAQGVKHITEEEAIALGAGIEEEDEDDFQSQVFMPEDAVFENEKEVNKINTIVDNETVVAEEEKTPEEPEEKVEEDDGNKRSFKFGKTEDEVAKQPESAVADDDVILSKLSDMLGEKFNSFDDIKERIAATTNKAAEIQPLVELDEELQALLKFKQETGRSLDDYVLYQSLNTSEMDDLNAVRLSFKLEYPDLNDEAREELLRDKYRLDEDEYTEREQRIGKAQLQADSAKAKKEIERLRSSYMVKPQPKAEATAPKQEEAAVSIFDDKWMNEASKTIDEIDRLEFNISKDLSLKIGLEPTSKAKLKEANKNIENYFDRYVNKDGSWNHELFNAHSAVIENIEMIVGESYKQGISKGQRELLDRNTNANPEPPRGGGQSSENNDVKRSLQEIYRGQPKMTVRL